jgi:MarR-like DNA-binding transcriptional regulator SgrR of sgrS sRNA
MLAVFAAGLNQKVARTNHAFKYSLLEVHGVHTFKRNFDTRLGDDAMAINQTIRGDHEICRAPFEVANNEPNSCQGSDDPHGIRSNFDQVTFWLTLTKQEKGQNYRNDK